MTSSGGVGYGRVMWRPVSGPRGLVRWRTGRSDGRWGADATLSWRDVDVTWVGSIRRVVSGSIGPLMVRWQYWQAASRYDVGATRGSGLTSPSDTFREVMSGHRGRLDIDLDRRMGKPESDGRWVA